MVRILPLCLLAAASGSAFAVDGLPDSTFGLFSSGRNFIALNNGGTNSDSTVDVLVNADRSIFMVGTSRGEGSTSRYAITKLTPDGTIDLSFGTNGTAYSALADVQASRARLDAAGNVVIVGTATFNGTDKDFNICRFNAQGQPAAFSGTGTSCRDIAFDVQGGNRTDEARDFLIDSLGRITIAGTAGVTTNSTRIAFARLAANGELDASFGGGDGKITHQPMPNAINRINALARKPNGKYYAVGEAGDPGSADGTGALFAVLTPTGALDLGFQDGLGFTRINFDDGVPFHRDDVAKAVEIMSDGRVVVAGTLDSGSGATERNGFVIRLDNVVDFMYFDTSFGNSGRSLFADGYTLDFKRMLVQSDDRIVVVGSRKTSISADSTMHVIRLDTDGTFDALNFGSIGRVNVDFGLPGGDDYGTAVASQDGSLLIAGHSKSQNSQDLDQTVTRLHNDLIFADGLE